MQGLIQFDPRQSAEMAPLMADAVGKALNFVEANPLTSAALATSTTPVVGDVLGLAADAEMYATDPESRTPVNFALTAAGLIPFVPAASGAIRNVARADTPAADTVKGSELEREITGSPRLSAVNYGRPVSEMSYQTVPSPQGLIPFRQVTPEEVLTTRTAIIPLIGDRTMAGDTLVAINDMPLSFPVDRQGGATYMRSDAQRIDDAVWASGRPIITGLQNKINRAADEGADQVLLAYTNMAGESGDASVIMSDAMMAQIAGAKIPKSLAKQFDAEAKKILPEWKGVLNPEAAEQLRNLSDMKIRAAIIKLMDKSDYQRGGFPDMASTRFAITDPRLVHTPSNLTGLEIARGIPFAETMREPQFVHNTYPVALRGEYIGGFGIPLPREIAFPEFVAQNTLPASRADQSFRGKAPIQFVDQEYIDNAMGFLEQAMKNDR